jgi:hypothetical protein
MLPAVIRGPIARLCGAAVFLLLIADVASATTMTFQQGVDGYAGGANHSYNYDGSNRSTARIRIDLPDLAQPDGRYAWIFFDDIFDPTAVPMGSVISSATLSGSVLNPFGSADLAQVLLGIDNRPLAPGSLPDGAGTFYGATIAASHAACADVTLCDPPVGISWDVTSILQDWASGAANLGFLLIPTTTNGGDLGTHGNADPNLRPELSVTFLSVPVPEPASVLLFGIGALALARSRRRA